MFPPWQREKGYELLFFMKILIANILRAAKSTDNQDRVAVFHSLRHRGCFFHSYFFIIQRLLRRDCDLIWGHLQSLNKGRFQLFTAFLIGEHNPSPWTQSEPNGSPDSETNPGAVPCQGGDTSLVKTRWSSYSLNSLIAQEITSCTQNRCHFFLWWNAMPEPTGRQEMGEETSKTDAESQHKRKTKLSRHVQHTSHSAGPWWTAGRGTSQWQGHRRRKAKCRQHHSCRLWGEKCVVASVGLGDSNRDGMCLSASLTLRSGWLEAVTARQQLP